MASGESSSQSLVALSKSRKANKGLYRLKKVDSSLLEKFKHQKEGTISQAINLDCPEFTSLCPVTGQPDFGEINIVYVPDVFCVESKSLKLYLFSFRNHGAFHESCIQTICSDLVKLLAPKSMTVWGKFRPRGGIAINPTSSYFKSEAPNK